MNDLVSNRFSISRSAYLAGISRSTKYYQRINRKQQYDVVLEKGISEGVTERPSYGSRNVTAVIRLSDIRVRRNCVRRRIPHMNLISTKKKDHRKHVPRTIVVARPNIMWGTDFTAIYIEGEDCGFISQHTWISAQGR